MQIQGVVLIPSQRFLLSLDMSSQDSPDISDKAKEYEKLNSIRLLISMCIAP